MKTQVAIVGGGPGGSACAMFLKRHGIASVIIERETFPRFHIGESMTGEAGGVLRDLGFEPQLLKDRHPVKHGVAVFGPNGKNRWFLPVMQRKDGELVDQITWQVRRSVFDKMMLEAALATGAGFVNGRATTPLLADDGSVRGVNVKMADGGMQTIESDIVLDCSGQATWLANRGVTGAKYLGAYDKQVAIFTHIEGYQRDNGPAHERELQPGNTLIYYQKKYHWAWCIPIDDNITSVGVVTPSQYFQDQRESKPDFLKRELRELNSALAERAPDPKFVEEVHAIPNYSLQVQNFAGRGYICIGDAHRFLDPIFSFGLFLSLKEAEVAAVAVKDYLNGKNRDEASPFEDYMMTIERGADLFEDVIDTFWENPLAFALFTHQRFRSDLIDLFAGRIFDPHQPSPGMLACRDLLDRTRSYEPGGNYSVPIGSRYHEERAPLWNANLDSIETTERWMREWSSEAG